MQDQNELFNKLINKIKSSNNYTKDEIDTIIKAYEFAKDKHKNMKRLSGDDYIIHPISVALILVDLNTDNVSLAFSRCFSGLTAQIVLIL